MGPPVDPLLSPLRELLDAVFPPRCPLCEAHVACPEHRLPPGPHGSRCGRCARRLPRGLPDGYRCAACRRRPPAYGRLVVLDGYPGRDGALREWILALKHGGRRDLARPLGRALARRLQRAGEPGPGALLVPVPLHPWRRFERGHDQALGLARAVGRATGLPVVRALRRLRYTPAQGAAGAVSRRANVRGAFAARRLAARRLRGVEVWLVDDVVTSGATLEECARVLRSAGAGPVAALAAARAGPA